MSVSGRIVRSSAFRNIDRLSLCARHMASISKPLPHVERTAAEPRENQLEPVILSRIHQVNDKVRVLRLSAVDPKHTIRFLPGQWVDTFVPGLHQAGGFTITSTPNEAQPSSHSTPFVELAIQKSNNPPAKWLWRPEEEILNKQLVLRVGGSFTWPPLEFDHRSIERLVLVAGGVGINPLISIFSYLIRIPSHARPREIHFLYGTKADAELERDKIPFLARLLDLVGIENDPNVTLRLYLTGTGDEGVIEHGQLPNLTYARRISEQDLVGALDGFKANLFGAEHDRKNTVAYVCGPPKMTDEVVDFLQRQPGMSEQRVRCEKWW